VICGDGGMQAKNKVVAVLVAIVSITLLETIALLKGIDGQLFATAMATIAALVGYLFGLSGRGDVQ